MIRWSYWRYFTYANIKSKMIIRWLGVFVLGDIQLRDLLRLLFWQLLRICRWKDMVHDWWTNLRSIFKNRMWNIYWLMQTIMLLVILRNKDSIRKSRWIQRDGRDSLRIMMVGHWWNVLYMIRLIMGMLVILLRNRNR